MKNLKKYLAFALAAVLLVVGTFAATVAWMTDEEGPKKNVFTVGTIDMTLEEEVSVDGDGATVEEVVDAEGVMTGSVFTGVMPGDVLNKKVTVSNDGDVPMYAAVTVTLNNAGHINDAIDDYYEALGYTADEIQAVYDDVFPGWDIVYDKLDANGDHLGMRLTCDRPTDATLLAVDSAKTTNITDNNYLYAYDNWFHGAPEQANNALTTPAYGLADWDGCYYYEGMTAANVDKMENYELRYTYYVYLEPGEEYTVFEKLTCPEYFTNEQVEMFKDLTIEVSAAAIQADNFDSAEAAFQALSQAN